MTTETVVVDSKSTVTAIVSETNTVVQTSETPTIVVGGIMGPPGTSSSITNSSDVNITNLKDGSILVYDGDSAKWQATDKIEKQVINAGFF